MMLDTPFLVGLGGAQRSGKDEVANILVRRFGFHKLGMSDRLNDALMVLNPLVSIDSPVRLFDGSTIANTTLRYRSLVGLVGYEEAKTVPEVRRLLQVFGTEVGRDMIDVDLWANLTFQRAADYLRNGHSVVVTGIRFENELHALTDTADNNFVNDRTFYVTRPQAHRSNTAVLPVLSTAETHSSETSLLASDFDCVLNNKGTLSELEATVIEHMYELGLAPTA